jgi:hypothetical protein
MNKDKVIPEVGLLALLASLGLTLLLCNLMERLLGQAGVFPSIIGGLLLGMEARKIARKISAKVSKRDDE